jgi:hypothetical protein
MNWIDTFQMEKYKWPIYDEKVFSPQEDVNQNYIEIPSHLSQIGHHQENKHQQMLVRMLGGGGKGTVGGNVN